MRSLQSIPTYNATNAAKPTTWLQTTIAVAALALTAATAHAVVLPVTKDNASTTAGQLNSSGGKAVALAVTKTTKSTRAYLDFDVAATGLQAADVTQARLKIYISAATTPGDLAVAKAAGDWSETTAGVAPGAAGTPVAIPLAAVAKRKFILVDVTQIVKDWLATPTSDFGFIIEAPNATTKVQLGSKEGSAIGYPAELEIDLTPEIGLIGDADLDPAFVSTLPRLDQGNSFTGPNTFLFGSGARSLTIQDDSSGNAPVLNLGGTGINAGKLRLRNELDIFPSDDGTRGATLLMHNNAGVSTIGMFGATGDISAAGVETGFLGVNGPASFSFFNGGPAKVLTIKGNSVDQTPELVVPGVDGILRVRDRLDISGNEAGTKSGVLTVRDNTGGTTITADGLTGDINAVRVIAPTVSSQAMDTETLSVNTSLTSRKVILKQGDETVVAGSTVPSANSYVRLFNTTGGNVTLNTTTAIQDGTTPGQMLILMGTSANTVTVPNNANTDLGAARVLGLNDTLTLLWNGFDWVETAFSNNS